MGKGVKSEIWHSQELENTAFPSRCLQFNWKSKVCMKRAVENNTSQYLLMAELDVTMSSPKGTKLELD